MKRTFSNRCVTLKRRKKMKKNLFMVAAVALMALTACNKEEVAGGNQDVQPVAPTTVVEFTASFSETKTALNAEGKKTLWVETDRIDINGQEFKIKELVDGGLAAKFENVNELPANFAAPFTAKYPYGVAEVPATQTAKAGTFDPTAVLEIATSDDHNLSFTNVTSLLKFQVPAACQTVTISSDDVLAGSDAKTVTVNGPFAKDETYYAAVLPGTKANFVVRIDGRDSKSADEVEIDKSCIANMGVLPMKVRIFVTVWPHSNEWTNWKQTPKIHYWGDYGETSWPGVNMILETGSKFYYEFEYSTTKKTKFLINNGTGAEKSGDSDELTMNKDYSYEVWTEWNNNYEYLTLHKN